MQTGTGTNLHTDRDRATAWWLPTTGLAYSELEDSELVDYWYHTNLSSEL